MKQTSRLSIFQPFALGARACAAIAILSFSVFATQAVNAQEREGTFFGNEAKGKWIIGVKVGKIDNNIETVKDADAIGIVLGYEFDRPIGGAGTSTLEFEYIGSDDTDLIGIGEYDIEIFNAFFTYRTPGQLYFKVKGGASYTDIGIRVPNFSDTRTGEDITLAAGIGLGYHVGDFGVIELEASKDSGDADVTIVGINALLEF